MPTLRLMDTRPLTPRVSHFVFEAPFAHLAGQHIALQAELGGSLVERCYSIASPPRPDWRIELCLGHEGLFGAYLRGLLPGEAVECSDPSGEMCLLGADKPSVYFAAGTGIAPVRAILLSQLTAEPGAEAALVQGARQFADLHFHEEFQTLAAGHSRFRYLPTVSRDDPGWNGRRGRVTAYVDEALGGASGQVAYICGQPDMVTDLRRVLAEEGIGDERQSYERY